MKINKVHLKNYRTHTELEIEFSEGINLLLGNNGAGKTSVLEAIGIAMFDTGNRSTVKESIKTGEKSATICIDFTGNDGLDYVVERRMGSVTRHRIYERDNPENELSGKVEVVNKVTELCGIKKNSSKIYESVVTVRQNEIVNLFMGTNSEREAVFNEIFDTEIYREIYKNYSKDVMDKYKKDIEITDAKIGEIAGMLIDVELLQNRLSQNLEFKQQKDKVKNKYTEEFKLIETKKEHLDKIQDQIKTLNTQNEANKSFLNSLEKQLDKNIVNLLKAEEAKNIVIDKRESYLEYRENAKELRDVQERLRKLMQLKSDKEKLNTEYVELEKAILNINNETSKNKEQIKLMMKLISELQESCLEKTEKYNETLEQEKYIKEELNDLSEIAKVLQIELNELNDIERKYLIKNSEIIKIKEHIDNFNTEDYYIKVEELNKNLKSISKQKKEMENLEKTKQQHLILLDQNKEASEVLGEGICPFLNENCKNISNHNNINLYFVEKNDKLNQALLSLEKKLEIYVTLNSTEEKINNEKNILDNELILLNRKKEELKYSEKELENLQLLDSNKKFELREKIDVKKWKDLESFISEFQFNELNEKLKAKKVSLETKLKGLNISDLKKEINKSNMDISVKMAEIKNIEKNIESQNLSISNYEKEMKTLTIQIENLDKKLDCYGTIQLKETELMQKEDILKPHYEKYMEYISTAKTYHDLKEENERLKNEIRNRTEELDVIKNKLDDLTTQYNEKEYSSLKDKLIEFKAKIDLVQKELFDLEYEIKDDEKELKRFRENKDKIKNLQSENNKLKKKFHLTEKFREYINRIGKNISKQMIEKISFISTENFREITGRSEMLEWRTTDKEAYMLYLVDDKSARKFTLLSGGEQVATALAVRAAMASALSKANFAIFDEPTNNLDEERRKALADSLSKLLEGIKQSIIVTHDDTFQEMANKIIRL